MTCLLLCRVGRRRRALARRQRVRKDLRGLVRPLPAQKAALRVTGMYKYKSGYMCNH